MSLLPSITRKFLNIFSLPYQITAYELKQRQETLNKILWIILVVSIPLAWMNYEFGAVLPALVILSLVPVCLLAIIFNKQRPFILVGIFVSSFLLFTIFYDIFDAGGLRSDMGAVALPVFIAISGLLFGKRGIFFHSIITVISVITLGFVEISGIFHPQPMTDLFDVGTVIFLLIGMACIQWIIIDNNDKNLSQIKKKEISLRVSNELILESLAKALEYRDMETKNHSSRVVEMSVLLARAFGLQDDDLVNIKHGALLHDIGKLGIPDSILHKPGKLTDEEWEIMKTHPVKAIEILEGIPVLSQALEIPYAHHENWDGTGYPRGLKGEQIPLYARLFNIIDQWEALTNDRVYRKAWPYERVIQYIKDNSGRLYDPRIADTFLRLIKSAPESFQSNDLEGGLPVDSI